MLNITNLIPERIVNRDLIVPNTITLTSTTETTLLAGQAGWHLDITHISITNTSATAVRVDLRDQTAGTVRLSLGIAANGGAVLAFDLPWPQLVAGNNWTAQLSGAVTDIRINVLSVKNT